MPNPWIEFENYEGEKRAVKLTDIRMVYQNEDGKASIAFCPESGQQRLDLPTNGTFDEVMKTIANAEGWSR